MERIVEVSTGPWRGPGTPVPPGRSVPFDPAVTGTRMPLHHVTHARAVSAPVVDLPRAPAVPSSTRRRRVTAPAVGGGAALLVSAVSVLLPWHDAGAGAPGIVGSAFGLTVLIVNVALLATAVVDVLEGRVRWTAAVLVPPLALLAVVLSALVAALVSSTPTAVHLALAGVPWPGAVVSGPGVWVFLAAQCGCLAAGTVGVVGWLRGWGDPEPAPPPWSRRPAALAVCGLVAVLAVVVTGVVLAGHAPAAPQATVGAGR